MTTSTIESARTDSQEFQTAKVLPIVGAHFVHDVYTALFPTVLPELINKLSLSLTQAAWLNAILQIPGLLYPLLGYLADRVSLRYFVIFAPAATATLMSLVGWVPNYFALALILFVAGVSIAAFHAPAPAMIARVSGVRVGLGMSLFMAFGELSRSVGPLLAAWVITNHTLDGLPQLMVLGWLASLLLFWRLRKVPARPDKAASIRLALPFLRSLFLPLALVNLLRYPMMESLNTFLPTLMRSEGASVWGAGWAQSALQFAAVGGALLSGPISDRLGRRRILAAATLSSAAFMLLFMNSQGAWTLPLLLLLGFTALSTTPVMLAMVQEQMPHHRAVGNGLFMLIAFVLRPPASLAVGYFGDLIGLREVFVWSAWISLLALPLLLLLPKAPER
jgi:FSR family fosmidomycin resistance protein-like MFS transporter